jgi:HK97 family phage major capsid protein
MGLKRADEIRTRMAAVRTGIDTLEQAEPDTDEHTRSQQHQQLDDYLTEWDALSEELKPLEAQEQRILAVRSASLEPVNLEAPPADAVVPSDEGGDGSSGGGNSLRSRLGASGPDVFGRQKLNPFADLDTVRSHMMPPNEVRSRAALAVEQYAKRSDHWALNDDSAENVTQLIYKRGAAFGKAISEQILVTGSPEYLAAFESYLQDPGGFSTRAALSLTPANGGYLVPFTLDPTIILTNAGSANPYRRFANIKTTTTNDWNGVTSAGVSAEWTAEGIEAADATPTVGQLKITPQKADAYLFGSYEVLGDSDFAQQLPDLLADAKDRLEETAFAVGTGTGQPFGVITRGTTLAAAAGTAATGPGAADVYNLMAALPARFRGPRSRPVWVANLTTVNRLRNVPAFSGATTSILQEVTPGDAVDPLRPAGLLGRPIYESTSVVGAFANGNKVLAFLDGSQYYIVDRVGMSVVYDPIVLGANRRPTGQGAWYAFWRVGADVSVATAIRVLTLTT